MLQQQELTDLYRTYRHVPVLSVYLHGEERDFARRAVWRRNLERGLAEARVVAESAAETEAFDAAATLINHALGVYQEFLPARGWVGFATADELVHGTATPAPVPDLVRWEPGLRVAPYVRVLKQTRPIITAILDQRQARLFRYVEGRLEELERLDAGEITDTADIGTAKRAATHSGVRGQTSTDAARRQIEVGAERLARRAAGAIESLAGADGLAILGGTPEMIALVGHETGQGSRHPPLEVPSLHMGMTEPQVRTLVEDAASRLSQDIHSELVEELIGMARSEGRGALGREHTVTALEERRVEMLVIARGRATSEPDFVDYCVGAALEQGADVEEVAGPAEARLEDAGGGIGARLRYRL